MVKCLANIEEDANSSLLKKFENIGIPNFIVS
jgi:hypothetical protein